MWCTTAFHTRIIVFFLMFLNDSKISTKLLDLTIFADDNNLFYTNKNMKVLFKKSLKHYTMLISNL